MNSEFELIKQSLFKGYRFALPSLATIGGLGSHSRTALLAPKDWVGGHRLRLEGANHLRGHAISGQDCTTPHPHRIAPSGGYARFSLGLSDGIGLRTRLGLKLWPSFRVDRQRTMVCRCSCPSGDRRELHLAASYDSTYRSTQHRVYPTRSQRCLGGFPDRSAQPGVSSTRNGSAKADGRKKKMSEILAAVALSE